MQIEIYRRMVDIRTLAAPVTAVDSCEAAYAYMHEHGGVGIGNGWLAGRF